jgi:hypothetical protein
LKIFLETAPGGIIDDGREGTPGIDTAARPPSVVFSAVCAAARTATPFIAVLLDTSSSFASPVLFILTSPFLPFRGKHFLQFSHPLQILSLKRLFFESTENREPNGHTQLHHTLPLPKNALATTKANITNPQCTTAFTDADSPEAAPNIFPTPEASLPTALPPVRAIIDLLTIE